MRILNPDIIAYVIYARKRNGETYVTIHYSNVSMSHRTRAIKQGDYKYYCRYTVTKNGEIRYDWSEEFIER